MYGNWALSEHILGVWLWVLFKDELVYCIKAKFIMNQTYVDHDAYE